MHITHVQGIFSLEHGGPCQSTQNYCRRQVADGHRVSLRVLEGHPGATPAVRMPAPVEQMTFPVGRPSELGTSAPLRRQLATDIAPDVYHIHGTWLRAMHYAARAARQQRVPYVVEMMGSYEPFELQRRWLPKQIIRTVYQDRDLREAACLHVNSRSEGLWLRRLGFRNSIAVVPVGVNDEPANMEPTGRPEWMELATQPFVLFFARIHPKKGLDRLFQAWAALRGEFPTWKLVVAGAGLPVDVAAARAEITRLGITNSCRWLGRVEEGEKTWLLRQAAIYCLPSLHENFGNTVAEALMEQLPVVTTVHTPWEDVPRHGCGWQVTAEPVALAGALREAMCVPDALRRQMGERGRELVHAKYSLAAVGRALEALYHGLRGEAPLPAHLMV